jgi:hypothetical protein
MIRIRPLIFAALLSALAPACSQEQSRPSTPTTPTPTSPTTPPGPAEPPTAPAPPATCSYTATADPDDFEPGGGNGTMRITTAAGCRWSVTADASWGVIEGAQQGEGPAVLKVFVQPNDSESERQMAFKVADQIVRVVQPGQAQANCNYEVSPVIVAIPPTAWSGQISMATSPGCQWQVASDVSWLRVRPSGGSGSATVGYDVDANPETGRSVTRLGVLAFRWRAPTAGQNVRVTQWGSCSIGVAPATGGLPPGATFSGGLPGNWAVTAGADGGTFHLWVLTEPFVGCPWTVESADTWLTVTSPRLHQVMSGDGDLHFTLPPNPTSQSRRATLSLEGKPLTITQSSR